MILKSLKRDKITSFLLIIGLVLTSLLVFYSVDIMDKWLMESINMKGEGECVWQEYYAIEGLRDIGNEKDYTEGIDAEEEKKLDVHLQKISKQLSEALDEICLLDLKDVYITMENISITTEGKIDSKDVTLILNSEDEFYKTLQKGEYIAGENVCYVGENVFEGKTEDKYITLNKENIPVAGIFKNYKAYGDRQICVYYNKLRQETKELVLQSIIHVLKERIAFEAPLNVIISVGSNSSDNNLNIAVKKIEEIFNSYENISLEESVKHKIYVDDEMKSIVEMKFVVIMLVLAFTIINIYQISKIWIIRKRKNVGIAKAFGIHNGKIYILILKQLFAHIIASLVFTIIIAIGFKFSEILDGEWRILRLLVMDFIGTSILVLLVVTINVQKYLKKNVMEVIKR